MVRQSARRHVARGTRPGFTLVELLVVIGIIGVLISILLPSLNKAQNYARQIQCQSNMRSVGQSMLIYAQQYNGYLFPPDKGWKLKGGVNSTVILDGYTPPQYDVWPFYVLKQWDHPVMQCPSDLDLNEARHSYLVNAHLLPQSMKNSVSADGTNDIKYSSVLPPGKDPTQVIVMGEKISAAYDYYMESGDFDTKVEPYRHGPLLGSNYLMLDMHVETELPAAAQGQLDPWALPAATTQPS